MKITDDTIEHTINYIIIAATITVLVLIMIGVGNALTANLPTIT